ncbi:MAG: hypothetical protein AABW84_01930 [Nanoarchaeota archaeon]
MGFSSPLIKRLDNLGLSEELLLQRSMRDILVLEAKIRGLPDSPEKRMAEDKLAVVLTRVAKQAEIAASLHRAEARRLKKFR